MTYKSFLSSSLMLVGACLGFALMAGPANAATIDLSPLTTLAGEFAQGLVDVVAAVLVGVVAWAGKKLFGLQIEAKQRESLHGAIERGIGAAFETMLKKAEGKGSFEVDNEIIALVANYVVKMSPGAVKHFGLEPDKLADLITAKIGERLMADYTDVALSPEANG